MNKIAMGLFLSVAIIPIAAAQPPLEGKVKITKGIASIYRTDVPFANIVTGDPTVVDVSPLTDRSILVEGKHTGTTNLIFLDKDKLPLTEVMVSVSEQGAGFMRIHNKAKLNSFTFFNCWDSGCEFVGENTVAEPAPLPQGYLNQNVNQRIDSTSQSVPPPLPAPTRQ